MERIVAIIMITIIAIALYGFYWQYANCTTEFTEHGHPITVCVPMEYRHR